MSDDTKNLLDVMEECERAYEKAAAGEWSYRHIDDAESIYCNLNKPHEAVLVAGPVFDEPDAAFIVAIHNAFPQIAAAVREYGLLRKVMGETAEMSDDPARPIYAMFEKLNHDDRQTLNMLFDWTKRLGAAQNATAEKGWLIEKHEGGAILWARFTEWGVEWTTDSLAACRFARREDAEQMAYGEDISCITEHIWGPAPATAEVK